MAGGASYEKPNQRWSTDIDVMKKELSDINGEISDAKNELANLKKKLTSLQSSISSIIGNVNNISNSLSQEIKRTPYSKANNIGAIKTITVNGDSNTYYPVTVIPTTKDNVFPIVLIASKMLGSKSYTYPGSHSTSGNSMSYCWLMRCGGWDGNQSFLRTIYAKYSYASLLSEIEINTSSGYQGAVIWLRGGGTEYKLHCNDTFTANVYYQETYVYGSASSQYKYSVKPRTTIGNAGVIDNGSMNFWPTA